jgi:4-hydroxyphenylacetate 3-monooxygenase
MPSVGPSTPSWTRSAASPPGSATRQWARRLLLLEAGLAGPVQEKLATLAVYRETINAHPTAAIACAERSPAGLLMPNQSLLYTGRVQACSRLHEMMHIARELCGGQICVTPDAASFANPETSAWLEKYYTINAEWHAEDRRKLLALARDLLNSDYAGHRLTFQLLAQSPPYAHLAAVFRSFDFDEALACAHKAAGLSERVEVREPR